MDNQISTVVDTVVDKKELVRALELIASSYKETDFMDNSSLCKFYGGVEYVLTHLGTLCAGAFYV